MRTKTSPLIFHLVKSFLSLKFTALLVLLLMFNCQKDDTVEEPTQNINQSRYYVKIVNKDFFENNSDLTRKLAILNPKPKGNIDSNSGLNREIYNEEYGFTIETDYVKYVEDFETGSHSYSFPLTRDIPEDDKLENLVFQSNDLGTYDAFIVKYGFTKEEYEFLEIEQLENLSTKYSSIVFDDIDLPDKDSERISLQFVCIEVWVEVNNTSNDNGNLDGSTPVFTDIWVLEGMDCEWQTTGGGDGNGGNDGPPPPGDYNDNTTNGTNTTGGGTTNPQYPFISSPTTIQPWQEVLECMNSVLQVGNTDNTTLTDSTIQWLQNHKSEAGQINQFLEQNSCSEEAQELVDDFEDVLDKIPDAKFERYLELLNKLDENPWFLIQDCAEQNGLDTSNYLELYNLPFPQECTDKLNNTIGVGPHQPITDGNVPCANIDYYSVEVTEYPDLNGDGSPETAAEIYQAFRNNFIEFGSGQMDDFQFSCDTNFDDVVDANDTGDIDWEFEPITSQDGIDFASNDPVLLFY